MPSLALVLKQRSEARVGESVHGVNPSVAEAERLLAKITRGDTDRAIGLLNEAIVTNAGEAAAHAALSRAYALRGHQLGQGREWFTEAAREAERAIDLDPAYVPGQRALLSVCSHRGWLGRGLAIQRELLRSAPDDADGLRALGWLLWFSGEAAEAIEVLERAIALAPDATWSHFYLGNAFLRAGRADRALVAYQEASRLRPDLSSPRAGVGWALIALGQEARARAELGSFAIMPVDEDRIHVKIADLALYLGDIDLGRVHAEEAVRLAPESRYRPRGVCATTILARLLLATDRSRARQLLDVSEGLDRVRLDEGDEGYEPRYDLAAVQAIRGDAAGRDRWLADARATGWGFDTIAKRDPLLAA